MNDSELKREVETALHSEVRLRGRDISVAVEEGAIVLKGQVPELAEKRLAVNLVRRMREVGEVRDQLRLFKATEMTDRQIKDHIMDGLQQDGAIHELQIDVQVKDAVVTLSGKLDNLEEKRLAGLIAWWVPGVVDVDNQIVVEPHQEGNDGDLIDSIRQAFYKDIMINADTVGVTAKDGVVTLLGTVASEEARMAAEHDAYYIWGVKEVINRLIAGPR